MSESAKESAKDQVELTATEGEEAPEVVAHSAEEGEETPWCIICVNE